ncbi:MAG TPA: cytochrome c3 family protein [Anaeromyxobacter sp.]
MKTFAALVVAFALTLATSASAAAPEKALVLPAKPGNVTFNHKAHTALKCTQCHKDDKGGAIEGFGATVNKDKAHAACHECHKKEGKGPQKCADCHKK